LVRDQLAHLFLVLKPALEGAHRYAACDRKANDNRKEDEQ